jgi:hypothetical protein
MTILIRLRKIVLNGLTAFAIFRAVGGRGGDG